jgi:hypothetical protein
MVEIVLVVLLAAFAYWVLTYAGLPALVGIIAAVLILLVGLARDRIGL